MPPRPTSGAPGMAAKRIKKEIADLSREQLGDIVLAPDESDIFKWHCQLPGPTGSPYEGGVFDVDIRVPPDYPFSPPHLHFITKVYHCNIASTGAICECGLLKHAWSPALSLYKVVLSLSSLLTDPNPSDPLVPSIAQEYRRDKKKHDATAREWVKTYALPKPAQATAPTASGKLPKAFTSSTTRPRAIQRPSSTLSPAPHLSSTAAAGPSSASSTSGITQIAGTRRSANDRDPIDLVDSDDDDDEVVESASRGRGANGGTSGGQTKNSGHAGATANGSASGSGSGGGSGTTNPGERRNKRSRVNGNGSGNSASTGPGAGGAGGSAGDAIVIDE
ncbi:ubiquitin-conjugating enzyme 4 [Kwoniella heveanensis BCC8398]|uniref:E2 ubiquitin-conjugating enzyme n=1 Tax=Kwoniella heveanensis BCC8398 TaxID=1296120 RepID=A0A1B9GJ07_9TREE|nr:ubiquitin-conjugating enzyme 4 [Kwoniella heveanensis BCC8398]